MGVFIFFFLLAGIIPAAFNIEQDGVAAMRLYGEADHYDEKLGDYNGEEIDEV